MLTQDLYRMNESTDGKLNEQLKVYNHKLSTFHVKRRYKLMVTIQFNSFLYKHLSPKYNNSQLNAFYFIVS